MPSPPQSSGVALEARRIQRSRVLLDLAVVGLILANVRIGGVGISAPHEAVDALKDVSLWSWLTLAYGVFVLISPGLVKLLTHSGLALKIIQSVSALAVIACAYELFTADHSLYWSVMTIVSTLVAIGMSIIPNAESQKPTP
jgi:hypothetical protein